MNFAVLGPPGSGKGTQSARIARKLGIAHVSTGDILRAAIRERTAMGREAETYVHQGRLVPDEIMIGIVRERLEAGDCAKGFLLDGFPRTIPQARMLDGLGAGAAGGDGFLDQVFYFDISERECVRRLADRRTCSQCASTYNPVTHPPKTEGRCDACGGGLILRKDDAPETVKERFNVYSQMTAPLIDYYKKTQRLCRVDASRRPDEVFREVLEAIRPGIPL